MPNRLASETSPYLQQHAGNPVDWHPWGAEALRLARERDVPILLSVGYSACHWCHVMAHESFEDGEVAAEMNRLFVNVKVDREERPDIDQIYQTAHQMLAQRSGGWPLTMFLMPDGTPFFGGTYFPKAPRHGLPGFRDLLPKIADAYRTHRTDIEKQNAALLDALRQTAPAATGTAELTREPVDGALRELAQAFDEAHGGLGRAPKFPHPFEFEFCLRRHACDGSAAGLTMPGITLSNMAEGGIYDHLGGGFARYSVDRHWTIPHFEKMLYDNGPLLALYADAWRVTSSPRYRTVVEETAAWVMREMQSPEGGYYSSLDADSEHEEGKFYVWEPAEVRKLLAPGEYAVVARHYGLDGEPNFENHAWHLRVATPLERVAEELALPVAECESRLADARRKLLDARVKRVWPGRDEKVLASWNALMVKGMARAARVFGRGEWLDSARRATVFVRSTLWRDGRLLATFKDGKAHLNAYLDDHAFLLDALLELLQTDFVPADLDWARELAELLLAQFEDPRHGGFFFTSNDHENLIHRAKPGYDNATPSGNGVAAIALQRLGHLVGEPRYLASAERAIRLFYAGMARNPSAHTTLAIALEEWLAPPSIVVLRGDPRPLREWHAALSRRYRPDTMVLAVPTGLAGLPAVLDKDAPASGVNAWVCRGASCLPATTSLAALEKSLVNSG